MLPHKNNRFYCCPVYTVTYSTMFNSTHWVSSPTVKCLLWVSGRIELMVELIHCSHWMVYTNQTICWDPIETERSEATIPRRSRGDAKRQTPRVTAWSLWPVVQKDLVMFTAVSLYLYSLYEGSQQFKVSLTVNWRYLAARIPQVPLRCIDAALIP